MSGTNGLAWFKKAGMHDDAVSSSEPYAALSSLDVYTKTLFHQLILQDHWGCLCLSCALKVYLSTIKTLSSFFNMHPKHRLLSIILVFTSKVREHGWQNLFSTITSDDVLGLPWYHLSLLSCFHFFLFISQAEMLMSWLGVNWSHWLLFLKYVLVSLQTMLTYRHLVCITWNTVLVRNFLARISNQVYSVNSIG